MSEEHSGSNRLHLVALTPKYESGNHEVYLNAINSVLSGEDSGDVRNIALTGSYGTGKSSILQKIAKQHEKKVLQVSLSTLGIQDLGSEESGSQSKTNRIQKEIVKQFLYSEDPAKAPGSRFRRIGRLKFGRELAIALLAGPIVALVFLITGWSDDIQALVAPYVSPSASTKLPIIVTGAIALVAAGFTLAFRYLTHNRMRIEKVTAGPATISLAEDSTSYFDRYLDEIVYFFDVTKYQIVIFEDIDRFDDPHIFETLRALNTLLNGAKQLKGRSIRFIYAIKDSIFDELGIRAAREEGADSFDTRTLSVDAADAELARANRTKFFDLVVPVVPFITHQSARDLMIEVMSGIQHDVSSDLVDLAARHLADMRFLKNVRNEFVIFRHKVLPGSGQDLELNEDSLFGMVLYKGTHLSDFEALRQGQSKLDKLYKASRDLVAQNVARLASESRDLRHRIAQLDSTESRSVRLGAALEEYVERCARQVGTRAGTDYSFSFDGQNITSNDLRTVEFWNRFVTDGIPLTVNVSGYTVPGWGNYFDVIIDITREDAAEALGDELALDDWISEDRTALPRRLAEIQEEREFLLRADMSDLIARPDLKVVQSGGPVSLSELTDHHMASALARELVAAGYINRDFTLYSSTYHSVRVSTRARNFLMHNVDPNIPDFHFGLEPKDVESVISERGEAVLRERGCYNIAVLDHLLGADDERVGLLIDALIAPGDTERDFLQAYLSGGAQTVELVRKLTSRWPESLRFLISTAEVDDGLRKRLVSVALCSLDPTIDYFVGLDVKAYLEEHCASLTPFVDEQTDKQTSELIAGLLSKVEAHVGSLNLLSHEMLRAVVDASAYLITRANLQVALGESASFALDVIRGTNSAVYTYLLDNIPEYLAALEEGEVSLLEEDAFIEVLEDLVEHDVDTSLLEVIQRASSSCIVSDITAAPEASWTSLAFNRRFPATFSNVTAYLRDGGELDEGLAFLLAQSETILSVLEASEDAKQVLAVRLLGASSALPSPDLRASLVDSLALEEYIPDLSIPVERGNLLGLLVRKRIIADNATTYSLTHELDWASREYFISQSSEFAKFMTPTIVPVRDVAELLRSTIVSAQVKRTLVDAATTYTIDADRDTLRAVAEFAISGGQRLSPEELSRYASAGVEPHLILRVLQPDLAALTLDQLSGILQNLGGDYPAIIERNGKRPKLGNTPENLALVARLEELGVVSSYTVERYLTVNMKKSANP